MAPADDRASFSRRGFLAALLGGLAVLGEDWLAPAKAIAQMHGRMPGAGSSDSFDRFVFSQLRYGGGDWDPDPTAAPTMMKDLEGKTSVDAQLARRDVDLDSPELFDYPFLYITGHQEFTPWSQLARRRLARFVAAGGFVLTDDCAGVAGAGFDLAIRREMAAIFPEQELRRLSSEHPVNRSFYLLREFGARRLVKPYFEGIDVDGRTAVIHCANDVGCAWEMDRFGNWIHPCLPGGESQRRNGFHMGINILLYALSGSYKSDLLHQQFLDKKAP